MTGFDIIECAQSFVGVPYVPYGRSRDGVDCAGLMMAISEELGGTFKPKAIHGQLHAGRKLFAVLDECAGPPNGIGDILVAALPRRRHAMHLLINCGPTVVHADLSIRKVCECPKAVWVSRIIRSYSIPGVELRGAEC